MKYLIIAICILLEMPSAAANHGNLHLLDSLPTNFTYRIDTDSMAVLSRRRGEPPVTYTQEAIQIGCYHPVQVKPAFSLSIGHEFLFDDIEEYHLLINKTKTSKFKMILYAVKKENPQKDSLLLNALEDYCIYGQQNYYFQTNDYILFNYAYATNSGGIVEGLRRVGIWNLVENRLKNNLNAGASFEAKTQLPTANKNPFHQKKIISGKYLWKSGGLPNRKVKTQDGESHISELPATAHTYLHLKKNGKGSTIKNYHEKKSNHYKYKVRWFMDNLYVYIYESGYHFRAYRIHNENVLMQLSEEYGFSRIVN